MAPRRHDGAGHRDLSLTDAAIDATSPCAAIPFFDDFETRGGLERCWDAFEKAGPVSATSGAKIDILPGIATKGLRVDLVPSADGGPTSGSFALRKAFDPPIALPARVDFKLLVATSPTNGTGTEGFFAIEVGLDYKDTGKFPAKAAIPMAVASNGKLVNLCSQGGSATPSFDLQLNTVYEAAISLASDGAKLLVKTPAQSRAQALPAGTDHTLAYVRLGVTEVGSVPNAWTVYFDDVKVGPGP